LKEESENLRSDVVRLQVEKREAEDAGKSFFEKNKGMVKEVEDLKKAQQQQQINSTVSVPDINPLTGEIESLRAKVAEEVERRQKLEADLAVALEQSKSLASSAQEGETALQLELEKVRTALEAKEKELQSFHAQSPVLEEKVKRIAELEIELSTANDEAKASKSDVAKLTAELEVAAKSVAASEAELTAKIAEIAALTGAKASTEEQVSLLTTKLADFEALLAKTKEELEATKLAADGNVSHIKEQFACDQQTALDEAKKAFEAELQAAIAAARHEDVTKAEADMKEVTLKYDAQVADLEVKVSQLEIEVSAAAAALEAAKIKHTEELTAAVASERQRVEGAAQEELQYRLSSAESTAAVNMKAALQALGEDLRAASAASELALQERLTAEKLEAIASEKATAEAALAAALSELSNRLNSEKISALEDARRVSEELVEKVKAEAATVLANTTRQFEDKVAEVEAARQKAIAELHSAEER
jgi:polyhydroxyalkanoate synthesis regulator phasin